MADDGRLLPKLTSQIKNSSEGGKSPLKRIDLVDYNQASDAVKENLDYIKDISGGHVLNIFKVVGNHEKSLEGITDLIFGVYRSGDVDVQLTELVYLYTSTLNQCHY
jgi:alkylhydroperoxidase family enzyme